MQQILSAARVAPTACNRQPQRIIVVQQPENIVKVEKAYKTFEFEQADLTDLQELKMLEEEIKNTKKQANS